MLTETEVNTLVRLLKCEIKTEEVVEKDHLGYRVARAGDTYIWWKGNKIGSIKYSTFDEILEVIKMVSKIMKGEIDFDAEKVMLDQLGNELQKSFDEAMLKKLFDK